MNLLLELLDNTQSPWNISLVLEKPANGDPVVYFADNNGTSQVPPNPPARALQNLDPNSRIMSLTVIGNNNELKAYINAYREPVAVLRRNDVSVAPYDGYFTTGAMQDKKHLRISSITDSAHIYGVRFYSQPLSVERVKTASSYTPSELEQNFKLDSKRYGIGVHSDYNPSLN